MHWTNEGKLYICAFKDVFSNRIVGYSIDSRMKCSLAVDTVAVGGRPASAGFAAGPARRRFDRSHSSHRLGSAGGGPVGSRSRRSDRPHERGTLDYASRKAAFDKFDRFRADHRVRSGVSPAATDPAAHQGRPRLRNRRMWRDFIVALRKVWATRQSRAQLVDPAEPRLPETLEETVFSSPLG